MLTNLPIALQKLVTGAEWDVVNEGESDATVYRLDDGVIRYLKISAATAQYPVQNDYLRLQYLAGKIAVPQILYYSETQQMQYLLMSDCAGLHPLHDDLNWTVAERINLLAQAATDFHALSIEDCPYRISFDEQIALARHHIEHGLVDVDDWDEENQGRTIEDLFAEFNALKPEQEDWVLTHGDMYPMNIRVDEAKHTVTGFIDVGAMAVADRYSDLAVIANAIGWHHDADWIARFFDAYGIPMNAQKLRFYQLYQEFL